MSKVNISFNGEDYQIDPASLSEATAELRQHLSSVMNGTGATINFGGTTYNIDSTKLSTATNAFISHLGTVAGNGYKIVVGGVEYNIDSSKMSGAVSQLHEVLSGLHSGGDSSLEMNQYGFYFGVPYVLRAEEEEGVTEVSVTLFANNSAKVSVTFNEEILVEESGPCLYELNKITIVDEDGTAQYWSVADNGTKLVAEDGTTFILEADIAPSSKGQHMTVRTSKLNILDTVETTEGVFYKVSNLAPTISEIVGATVTMFNHADCESETGTTLETDCEVITDGVYVLGDMILIVTADKVDVMTKGAWVSAQLVGYAGDRTISVYWGYDEEGIPMNEYGFYFGRKYTKASDKASMSMVFFEDGTVRTIWKDLEAGGDPVYWEDTATYSQGQIVVNGGDPITVSDNGTKIDTGDVILTLEGSENEGSTPDNGLVMNEYGFYFNLPYVAEGINEVTGEYEKVTVFFYADGSSYGVFEIKGKELGGIKNKPQYRYEMHKALSLETGNVLHVFSNDGTKVSDGNDGNAGASLIAPKHSITWNTMEYADKTAFVFEHEGVSMIKLSDVTPIKGELDNTYNLIVNDGSQEVILHRNGNVDSGGVNMDDGIALACYVDDVESPNVAIFVVSAQSAGNLFGSQVPEAGLYVTNVGAFDFNADCTLNIMPEDNALNALGFYFDAPYVYYNEAMLTVFNWNFHADGSATYSAQHMTSGGDPIVVDYPAEDITYSQNQVEVRNTGNGTGEPMVWTFVDNGAKLGDVQGHLFQVAHPDAYDHCITIKAGESYGLGSVPWGETGESMVKVSQLTPSFNDLYTGILIVSTPETNMTIPLYATNTLMQDDNFIIIMNESSAVVVQSDSVEINGITLTKGSWSVVPSLPAEWNVSATIMWNDASDNGNTIIVLDEAILDEHILE